MFRVVNKSYVAITLLGTQIDANAYADFEEPTLWRSFDAINQLTDWVNSRTVEVLLNGISVIQAQDLAQTLLSPLLKTIYPLAVNVVDTLSDLAALDTLFLKDNTVVLVTTNSTNYRYMAGSVATADAVLTIEPDSGLGRWIALGDVGSVTNSKGTSTNGGSLEICVGTISSKVLLVNLTRSFLLFTKETTISLYLLVPST
jgi:hypothetical protein